MKGTRGSLVARVFILVALVLAAGCPSAGPSITELLVANSGTKAMSVLRYNASTGAFIDTFVAPGSGGLDDPEGLAFGPDGHLYVSSFDSDEVLRYNGMTGAFIDAFVTAGNGGLDCPTSLLFH